MGNYEDYFIVCEKAQRCRRRLFARLLFERSNRLFGTSECLICAG